MALELDGENILVSSVASRVDTSTVFENDVIVPDTKPDIGRVLVADGDVFISSMEADKDRVAVSGVVRYKIIYLAEGEEGDIRSITSDAPFSFYADAPGAGRGMDCTGDYHIEHLECNPVNSRKLNLKCFLRFTCNVREEKSFMATGDIRGGENLQMLRKEYSIKRFLGTVRDTFEIGQTLELPAGNPSVTDPLRVDVTQGGLTVEAGEGKVAVKGGITVSTLYRAEGEEEEIHHMEHEIPFTRYIDFEGLNREDFCVASCRIIDYRYMVEEDFNGESRLITLEAELAADVDAYTESQIEVIADAYSPVRSVRMEKESVRLVSPGGEASAKIPLREAVTIKRGQPSISKVYYVNARPVLTHNAALDEKIEMEGVIECSIMYLPAEENTPLCCNNSEIPFKYEIDVEGTRQGDNCDIALRVEHCGYSILSADEVEVRITLGVDASTSRVCELPVIVAAEEEEEVRDYAKPSLLLYFARKGDTLWNIAKKYRTTVAEIMECNSLDEDSQLATGQQILIP